MADDPPRKTSREGCSFGGGVTICGALRPATLTRGPTAMRNHMKRMAALRNEKPEAGNG